VYIFSRNLPNRVSSLQQTLPFKWSYTYRMIGFSVSIKDIYNYINIYKHRFCITIMVTINHRFLLEVRTVKKIS